MQGKKLKIIIAVLAILLAVSTSALIGILVVRYFHHREVASVEVPGNIITPESEGSSASKTDSSSGEARGDETGTQSNISASPDQSGTALESAAEAASSGSSGAISVSGTKASALSLHNRNPEDNTPFKSTNMFPGDRETKYYCIKVYYKGDIIVRYRADIRPGYEKLAEVLMVRISLPDTDELLYDGLMRDMPESLNCCFYTDQSTVSELYYEITPYLDTSVGNEYQNRDLIADFRWWVEETDHLDAPQTGDALNIYLWICVSSALLLLLLIMLRKRRKETADEAE